MVGTRPPLPRAGEGRGEGGCHPGQAAVLARSGPHPPAGADSALSRTRERAT